MSTRPKIHRLSLLLGMTLLAPFSDRLSAAAPSPKNPPATVEKTAQEADFNTVTLTQKAVERLNIKTVALERKEVPSAQLYGGEVMAAMNSERSSGSQSILPLLGQMTPAERIRIAEAQVDADGLVAAAEVDLDAAEIDRQRAARMLEEKSGSQRAVDEARARLLRAESELNRATARRSLLGPKILPGTNPDRIWIRVPVYAGDLRRIDDSKPARVKSLASSPNETGILAQPVDAPPSADAVSASVNLFYELEDDGHPFRLGERVSVSLSLDRKSRDNALVVPWASIIIDIYGGTWVYENTGEGEFVRKRVQLQRVVDDTAVLVSGPPVGAEIVTDGAAELFGTEVGFSK